MQEKLDMTDMATTDSKTHCYCRESVMHPGPSPGSGPNPVRERPESGPTRSPMQMPGA